VRNGGKLVQRILNQLGRLAADLGRTIADGVSRREIAVYIVPIKVSSFTYKCVCAYRIGHDNAGGGGAWYLDRVEIDCPHLGRKWIFPHSRWIATDQDDRQLERELFPQEMATEEYNPCKLRSCLVSFLPKHFVVK